MVHAVQTVGEILRRIDQVDGGRNALYLDCKHDIYVEGSRCAILDPEESSDPGVIDPDFAVNNSLRFGLFVNDVKGIVRNANQQIKNPTISDLIDALNYYLKFDAFIRFSQKR